MRSKQQNRKIYIVLTYTGTFLSKIIKHYTQEEFSHVSLSLDKELNEMYSFGRLNPYNPFIGGFIKEGIKKGTFKRFKNTISEIYCIELTNKQYQKIKQKIKKMKRKNHLYKFNVIGLFAIAFKIKRTKENYFYCAEFVKYLLDECKLEHNLPDMIKPNDFKHIEGSILTYRGILREYNV